MKINRRMGDFLLEREIGKGNFATVFLATKVGSNDNKQYAVKCISKNIILSNPVLKKLLNTEVSIMNHINHQNIMHLYEYFETENNFYLVINYCNGGDLESYMRKNKIKFFNENEALKILKQIMNGFSELRKYNIIHRDIKLSNIFIHDDTIIVGDFGFAKTGKEMTGTKLGTPLTMAPEIIEGSCYYSSKTDLWSLGVIFYQLLYGSPPFFGLSLSELAASIRGHTGSNLVLPTNPKISPMCASLLRQLLEEFPEKRISWSDFFQHQAFLEPQKKSAVESTATQESFLLRSPNTSVDQEFKKNQRSVTSTNMSTPPPPAQQSPEVMAVKIEPSPSKFTSAIMIEEILKMLRMGDIVQENFYRYSHELNKIHFLLNASRAALEYGLQGEVSSQNANRLLISSMLLLLKSSFTERDTRFSLVKRENILNLMRFDDFIGSSKYELVLDLFIDTANRTSKFASMLESEAKVRDSLRQAGALHLLRAGLELPEINEMLKENSLALYQSNFEEEKIGSMDSNFVLINVLIILGLRLNEMFPYWIETKKFNWNSFVKNYENMNRAKLVDIAKCLYEDLHN